MRSAENIAAVKTVVDITPTKSHREVAEDMGLKRESVRKILKADLSYKPFKIPVVQELKDADFDARVEACSALLELLNNDPDVKSHIMMTDECIFSLDSSTSPSHTRHWSNSKPNAVQQKPLQPKRQLVWCGMTARNVVGPYFFDGPVNAESYQHMLETFLLPELRRLRLVRTIIFQQDGAPAHTARTSLEWLRGRFGDRVISRHCDLKWPARSPDLTPPDFFLWGHLKLQIKRKSPQSLEQLREFIAEAVREVDRDKNLLERTFMDFVRRLRQCVAGNGSHVL